MRPRHVVMFSGGVGSWATARRVVDDHGTGAVTLLFADTLVEDADLYRFLDDAAAELDAELVKVADGRTPFDVFRQRRFLGNSRVAPCSTELKVAPCRAWLDANADPADTTVYVGLDWTEPHRLAAVARGWAPYRVDAPLMRPPLLDKPDHIQALRAAGVEPPRAYAEGFPHNNCLAQGCVRGGVGYWRHLYRRRPDVYAATEGAELDLRDYLDADVAMLTDRTGGERRPLTLAALRATVDAGGQIALLDEWGGCGCFTDDPTKGPTP